MGARNRRAGHGELVMDELVMMSWTYELDTDNLDVCMMMYMYVYMYLLVHAGHRGPGPGRTGHRQVGHR